jgi:transketolase
MAYGETLAALGKKNKDIVVLEADLGKSTQSILFVQKFPERGFEMGIAEQNMASTAAGLALVGKTPFIHSFAVFASGRTFDQLRNSVCIPNLNVRICGSSCGLSDYGDGKTHQSIEDMAILRAIPNMAVFQPADAVETVSIVKGLVEWKGPAYIRINRNDLPIVMKEDQPYRLGQVTKLRDGADLAIFATGYMVSKSLEAAGVLAKQGLPCRVLNVACLKPLDNQAIVSYAQGVKAIVTAEEHTVVGGLGSAVLEALRLTRHAPLEMVGIQDQFGTSGEDYEGLLERYGLTVSGIVDAARRAMNA